MRATIGRESDRPTLAETIGNDQRIATDADHGRCIGLRHDLVIAQQIGPFPIKTSDYRMGLRDDGRHALGALDTVIMSMHGNRQHVFNG